MSPKAMARLAGLLTLITIAGGVVAQGIISARFLDGADIAGTAARIAANKDLFRLGYLIYMIEMIAQVGMSLVFYDLLKPVSRPLARAALGFMLVGTTIKTFSRVFYYSAAVLTGQSLEAALPVLLAVNDYGPAMALLFFGLGTLIKGWVMFRASYFPRFLGVLSMIGGIGWLAFLWPPAGLRFFPFIALVALVGSVAVIGWLLVKGLDEERFRMAEAA